MKNALVFLHAAHSYLRIICATRGNEKNLSVAGTNVFWKPSEFCKLIVRERVDKKNYFNICNPLEIVAIALFGCTCS